MNNPADRFRKVEHHAFTLLLCRFCGSVSELWQRWERDDVWCSFVACSNFEDVDGEPCLFHLPDSPHFYRDRKIDAVRYWNLMMGPRDKCLYAGCGKIAYERTAMCQEHHDEFVRQENSENR